jgi:very-short-patch-repair endonuclease
MKSHHTKVLENINGELWIYPPEPSWTQRKLFGVITMLCRTEYKPFFEGAMEYRVGPYWVDIAILYKGYKIGIEVDGPGKTPNPERDKLLKKNGWKIIKLAVKYIDKDAEKTGRLLLDQICKIVGLYH